MLQELECYSNIEPDFQSCLDFVHECSINSNYNCNNVSVSIESTSDEERLVSMIMKMDPFNKNCANYSHNIQNSISSSTVSTSDSDRLV